MLQNDPRILSEMLATLTAQLTFSCFCMPILPPPAPVTSTTLPSNDKVIATKLYSWFSDYQHGGCKTCNDVYLTAVSTSPQVSLPQLREGGGLSCDQSENCISITPMCWVHMSSLWYQSVLWKNVCINHCLFRVILLQHLKYVLIRCLKRQTKTVTSWWR